MEFLEVPIFDDDLYKLIVRFKINLFFLALIVGLCYRKNQKSQSYFFTFVLMNVMVFFICFALKKLDLGLGMALGLFAIFAIIRYRTDAIRVKEMTYLFIVIGIAVINALSNKKTSYAELAFTNLAIFLITYSFEAVMRIPKKLEKHEIIYDKLELLRPDLREELMADLRNRIGLPVQKIKLQKIDLSKNSAVLTVYYDKDEATGSIAEATEPKMPRD